MTFCGHEHEYFISNQFYCSYFCFSVCFSAILNLFLKSFLQSGGADRRHLETADGPGVHAGVQWRAQPRPRAAQEHPGQGGAEETAALHKLPQATRIPRGLCKVRWGSEGTRVTLLSISMARCRPQR